MIIFKLLSNLYTKKDPGWIKDMEDSDINPVMIQRWLGMNTRILNTVKWLEKYSISLTPKMYIAVAWSVIPKYNKTPFVKYCSPLNREDQYEELWAKIRSKIQMSDNDFKHSKKYLLLEIEKDKSSWFRMLGMEKKFWKKHGLDYEDMKSGGVKTGKRGLDLFM